MEVSEHCYGGKLIEKKCVGGFLHVSYSIIAILLSEHILEVYYTKKFVFMALKVIQIKYNFY